MFEDFEIISRYTRQQAIEDGVLVDVSALAKEVGFRYPVAVTRTAWCDCVEIPEGVSCQDETGRLFVLLWCLRTRIKSADGPVLHFKVFVNNGSQGKVIHSLKSECHGGDFREPVITISLSIED